jgi:hypothetical protein
METKKIIKTGPQDLKGKRDSPSRRSLREILQQGAGSSGTPLWGLVATSVPAVEIFRAIDNHRLGSGARLKATDARNLPKPVKVALRVRDKVAQTQD